MDHGWAHGLSRHLALDLEAFLRFEVMLGAHHSLGRQSLIAR